MKSPKISVIIPVYNVEKYLEQCVRSVLQQTLIDVEAICVDDGSQDGSRAILERLASVDSRVKVCFHEKNKSVFTARKTGVAVASGEYILFLDSDDYLELNACELLYDKIKEAQVDVLHFTSRIVNNGTGNPEQQRQVEKLICPYDGKLTGADFFRRGFVEKKVWGTLWNKLYRSEPCKKALLSLDENYLALGEDIYTFCAISYYAQSYLGWKSQPLHNYRFGAGITSAATMNLQRFERQCMQAKVIALIASFCNERGVYDCAQNFVEEMRKIWRDACCDTWYSCLPKELSAQGWELLCKYWDAEEVVSYIAKYHFEDRKMIAQRLARCPRISLDAKHVKTVGIYYHRMYAGGVERVISVLAPMLLNLGYKVVIFTDEPPTEKDFDLPEEVSREVILSYLKTDWKNIDDRFASITQVAKKYGVDVVLYNAWMSNLLLWDMLHLKGLGIPVIVHSHGVFSCTMAEFDELFAELPGVMHLADGIITLSAVDKTFWDTFCDNVHCIPNPASDTLYDVNPGAWENNTVIWVGRASPEKQPEKIFDIMERVILAVPDAKLLLLGNFEDPKWKKLAKRKGLEKHIVFCGMVSNVDAYLERASVFSCTSQFEGFPMSLVEAQAHKLPTVMFRLPHLTMGTADRGVVNVDMDDVLSAADEIVKLLQNKDHWEANSALAYESFLWLKNYDLKSAWQAVLTGKIPESTRTEQTVSMVNTLIDHYDLGCRNMESKNAVVWFLQKAVGGVACCMENGLIYTIRLGMRKIKKRFSK